MRTVGAIAGVYMKVMKEVGHLSMSENPIQFREYIIPVLNEIL